MEPFFDGGLFEILIAASFVLAVNFVFAKKYLLYIFSFISISAPLLLFLYHSGEWFVMLALVCLFNAVFLVVLLWKTKKERPNELLIHFDYKQAIQKFVQKFRLKKQSPVNKL